MKKEKKNFSAIAKLDAILTVIQYGYSVADVCSALEISRTTWYRWSEQLSSAIEPVWGELKGIEE